MLFKQTSVLFSVRTFDERSSKSDQKIRGSEGGICSLDYVGYTLKSEGKKIAARWDIFLDAVRSPEVLVYVFWCFHWRTCAHPDVLFSLRTFEERSSKSDQKFQRKRGWDLFFGLFLVHSKINGKNCCSLVGCVSRCSLVFQSIGTRFDVCIGELVRTSGCTQYGCLLFLYFVRGKKNIATNNGSWNMQDAAIGKYVYRQNIIHSKPKISYCYFVGLLVEGWN